VEGSDCAMSLVRIRHLAGRNDRNHDAPVRIVRLRIRTLNLQIRRSATYLTATFGYVTLESILLLEYVTAPHISDSALSVTLLGMNVYPFVYRFVRGFVMCRNL
jgi:hypothetical protein